MRKRAFRTIAITASLLLMLTVPAQASPVQLGEVTQVVSGSQRNGGRSASVELRYVSNDDRATAGTSSTGTDTSASTSTTGNSSSSSITTPVQDPGATVQTEVTEDIGVDECECGDFTVPVAGFPKWPFIPLVGLVCLVPDLCTSGKCTPTSTQDENCKEIVCTDCCTNCNQVPEPASLILFGSGLVAIGARLRRRRTQIKDQATTISGS